MAVVMVVVAAAAVVVMVVMMLMLMIVVTVVAIMVVLMLVITVVMVMVMLVIMITVVMVMVVLVVMIVVVVAAAYRADLLLGHEISGQGVALLHGGEELAAGELVPGGGVDGGVGVLAPEDSYRLLHLGGAGLLGAAEDNGPGILHLVLIELTEVLHIYLALGGVGHGDGAAQHHIRLLGDDTLDGPDHVGQLAHTGGLDEDAVGVELRQHLLEGLAEVAHQRAADASGVHLGDLHACVLQKAAVDADLTKLILNENDLLPLQGLLQELFDKGGFPGAQKAGDHVYFCHGYASFLDLWGRKAVPLFLWLSYSIFREMQEFSRRFPVYLPENKLRRP